MMKFLAILTLPLLLSPLHAKEKIYRIMPVGDSITEGGSSFSNWRYSLFEKLYKAGYCIQYVGSRKSPSRIGDLAHEAYGGKNSSFLAKNVPATFKKYPAEIVLLHAGHNQFDDQKPIRGIVADTESMIHSFRKENPSVITLLAHPIPSGKLPKYAYLPELYPALDQLAQRLNRADSPVRIVPMDQGFDIQQDTIADLVHPNASGAEKIADHWFHALTQVMDKPAAAYRPNIITYKKHPRGELTLHIFNPPTTSHVLKPAIVFFFGGGWKQGSPLQFYPECTHFASRGMLAVSADYRTRFTHNSTPFDAVADAKSAIRHLRANARELGIDPNKITAAGASAGGHLAAATAMLSGFDDPSDNLDISPRPDALALWYPVLDNGPNGYGEAIVKSRYQEFSPLHNIKPGNPPTLIFLGTNDSYLPVNTAQEFVTKSRAAHVRCELKLTQDGVHPLYSWRLPDPRLRDKILSLTDEFLKSQDLQ